MTCSLVSRPDRLAERVARLQPRAVDENADVLAQTPAVIEHIGAQLRSGGEQGVERLANRRAIGLQRAVRDELAEPSEARIRPRSRMRRRCSSAPRSHCSLYPPSAASIAFERGVGLGAVGAAGLRHVGPAAAALAAERLGALAHQIDGVEARR